MRFLNSIFCSSIVLLAACGASGPRPEARVSSSEGAIRGAEEAGAKSVPRAALHLKLAVEERDKALAMMKDGNNIDADLMLQCAEADAELAVALSRETAAKADADKTLEQVQALKKKANQ
jgi:hypothetical protein